MRSLSVGAAQEQYLSKALEKLMSKIRVVIADDQPLFAGSMKIVLEGYGRGEIEVAGIAHNGKDAVELVRETLPQVVLMDVRMPVMDGVEATRRIHAEFPEIKIMILTTFDDDDYVHHALVNGAVAYVLKEIQPEELITAVKAINDGSYLISSSVGVRIVDMVRSENKAPVERKEEVADLLLRFPTLSHREVEVLDLITQSYDNHEIAKKLFVGEQTIKNYVSSIYAKLGVTDRIHAVRLVKEKK